MNTPIGLSKALAICLDRLTEDSERGGMDAKYLQPQQQVFYRLLDTWVQEVLEKKFSPIQVEHLSLPGRLSPQSSNRYQIYSGLYSSS